MASAFSAVGASASSATMAVAPLLARMKAMSSAPSMTFTGTSTTPSFAMAKAGVERLAHAVGLDRARRPINGP